MARITKNIEIEKAILGKKIIAKTTAFILFEINKYR